MSNCEVLKKNMRMKMFGWFGRVKSSSNVIVDIIVDSEVFHILSFIQIWYKHLKRRFEGLKCTARGTFFSLRVMCFSTSTFGALQINKLRALIVFMLFLVMSFLTFNYIEVTDYHATVMLSVTNHFVRPKNR